MVFTVLELGDVQGYLAGSLPGSFLDLVQLFAQLFVLDNLCVEFAGILRITQQEILNGFLDLLDNPSPDVCVAQLVLGLALEQRILQLDGNSTD